MTGRLRALYSGLMKKEAVFRGRHSRCPFESSCGIAGLAQSTRSWLSISKMAHGQDMQKSSMSSIAWFLALAGRL